MSGRVLVVDDDILLCQLIGKYLARLDYDVEMAHSAEDAWARVEKHPEEFDFYLLDLTLPGMKGDDLAEQVLRSRPDARILLWSGYPFEPSRRFANGSRVVFLLKPFHPRELAASIKDLAGPGQ